MDDKDTPKLGWKKQMNWPIFWMCNGFLILFIIACFINREAMYAMVGACMSFIGKYFGGLDMVLMVCFWAGCLIVGFSKWGRIKIGGKDAKRTMKSFNWYAIIMTTLLAGGGVFYSAAEPMYYFTDLPAHFLGIASNTPEAVAPALAQSYLHWGFLAWGVQAVGVTLLVYATEIKGLPMRASSMLFPVLGEKGVKGAPGVIFDGCAMIGVAAGTIGPTGFLGLQIAYTLENLWGIPNTIFTQIAVIVVATAIFTIGAATGLHKGIDFLAKWTLYFGLVIVGGVLLFGSGIFVVDAFVDSFGFFIDNFFTMAFSRGDVGWSTAWTVFYQIWFLSFGPAMAVLLVTISKGRTLRQVLLVTGILGPVITNFWFTILGGTGIYFELLNPGSMSEVLFNSGMPAMLLTIMQNMPASFIWVPLSIVLVVLFLVTTGAGVAYSMSVQMTNMEVPFSWVRVLCGVLLGLAAAVLVWIGADSAMNALQSFIVVVCMPLLFYYILVLFGLPKAAKAIYADKRYHVSDADHEAMEAATVVAELEEK